MIYRISFELEGLPRMANIASGKSHWRHAHTEKLKWKAAVAHAVRGKLPCAPLMRYRLTLVRVSATEPDFDGIVRGFKDIVDGLREAGVLAEDRYSNTGAWNCSWERCKRGQGKVRVTVEENMDLVSALPCEAGAP